MTGYGNSRTGYGNSPLSQRGKLISPGLGGTPKPPAIGAPVLNPEGGQQALFPGEPGAQTRNAFDVSRLVAAGGELPEKMLPPGIIPFEQLYRRLPEEGMFSPSVSPSNPFSFELGAFTVPSRLALMIFDLRPDIYRFSGVDPGDFMPLESRRYGSIMGFDITVDGKHTGQIEFELDPVAIQRTSQQAFLNENSNNPIANAGQFAIGQANSFSNVAGVGNALQPQRPTRYGALSIPFTIYAWASQTVQVRCVIFRPIPAPIAFIEYDMAGVLVPQNWATNMVEVVKPPQRANSESIR